jgi:putative hydrolase of the HAD superfamily
MIKNVVFDFGQVLVHFNPLYITQQTVKNQDDAMEITRVLFDRKYFDALDGDTITEEEVFEDCKTRLPERLWETTKMVYYSWPYNIPEIEGMRALIQKIKDKYGKSVFLLSNISKYFVSCAHEVPILRLIDNCIFSSVCRKVKPNQEIFEHLCNEYNILPSETLFIDDLQKNIDGAKKCGINGYVFDGDVQKLERYIDELFQENY